MTDSEKLAYLIGVIRGLDGATDRYVMKTILRDAVNKVKHSKD